MAFQPQNPFEFVEQLLMNAGQSVSQGWGRGLQATEQRAAIDKKAATDAAADKGKVAQQYGFQLLPVIQQLSAQIGDDDPELVASLGRLASEVERGILSDPSDAARIMGDARAKLSRSQITTEGISFPGDLMMGDEAFQEGTRTAFHRTETITEEEFSPQELITYSLARAGELDRMRSLSAAEQKSIADMAFEEFKSGLVAGRDAAKSNYDFGQGLVENASRTLATLQTVSNMMPADARAEYEAQLVALQILSTSTPQAAYAIYEQSMMEGQDVFLALAEVSGLAQTLTTRQDRILARWDDFVRRIQDKEDVDPAAARAALDEAERLLPRYLIDSSELNIVRGFLGVSSAVYTPRYYRDNPDMMAAALMPYVSMDPRTGSFKIDEARLADTNESLFTAFSGGEGIAQEALRRLFMLRGLDDLNYAERISGAARTVLETGIGYRQLNDEGRTEVKIALGNPRAGDVWIEEQLASRSQLAAQAAEAAHRSLIAKSEIEALGLSAKLTEWALEGNYGALVAYQSADESRANDGALSVLISQAREVYRANLDMVRYDRDARQATSREALRKMQLGEYLNDAERAALQAQFELDANTAIRDLGMLGLRTHGEVAQVLSGIAEVVPAEWWDEVELPAGLRDAMSAMGLKPALQAISRSSQYALDSDLRDDVRDFMLNMGDIIPNDETEAIALIYAARSEMTAAGFSDAVQDGFVRFLRGSWKLLEQGERRADSADQLGWNNNALGWANYHLRAQELLRGNKIDDAKTVISFVDGLVDNQRQGLTQRHAALVTMGCAEQGSVVFGGPTKLTPTKTVLAGESQGNSCQGFTDQFMADYNQFLENESWHQDLVNAAVADMNYSPLGTIAEPLVGVERLPPKVIGDLTQPRNWDADYSVANLNLMPAGELLQMATGLAIAINDGAFGRAGEESVNSLYRRVMGILAGRYGPEGNLIEAGRYSQEQVEEYIRQIQRNR